MAGSERVATSRTKVLRDCLRLVSQHTRRIEVYSRQGDHWTLHVAEAGGAAPLTALDGALQVDRVYQGVELEAG